MMVAKAAIPRSECAGRELNPGFCLGIASFGGLVPNQERDRGALEAFHFSGRERVRDQILDQSTAAIC